MSNQKFVDEVFERSRPLAVDSMDAAAEVIAKQIAKGKSESTTDEAWARHLAWVIGFDALIDDRKRLRDLSSFMATDPA